MSRMDKRLLTTLRGIRDGTVQFKRSNPPHVANLLTGLCEDLGMDPAMGKTILCKADCDSLFVLILTRFYLFFLVHRRL